MTEPTKYESNIDTGNEWLGEIPFSWKTILLSQAVYQVKNKNSELQEKNLLSLSYGKIKRKPIDANGGLLPESFDGYNIIETNDIVLRLTDLQNDHRSLRVGISPERGIITSAYVTLRPRMQSGAKYLYYLLHTFDIRKGFYGMGSGVRQGLNYDEVKRLNLPFPTEPEQKAISDYLDKELSRVDAIISEAKASIEEYKAWKASLIYEAVTKGLNPDVEMKDSGVEWIGKIPFAWSTERLKRSFSFGKGLPITKENLIDNGFPVISYGQIHSKKNTGTGVLDELIRFVSDDYLTTNTESLAQKGDFLFADTSEDLEGCGNAVYLDYDDPIFAGYHTILLKSKEGKNNKYLAYLFKTDIWRQQIRSKVSGVKLFSISQKIMKQVTVILPPMEEQTKIVTYLDEKCSAIDSTISQKEELISDLESYKKSLIFEVVTGKRRVC